jgi:hypothetical protein
LDPFTLITRVVPSLPARQPAGPTEEGYATTPLLTLDQVRQAGRLAWHPARHYLFSEGRLLRVVLFSPLRSDLTAPISMNLRPSSLHGDEQYIQNGWRHFEECDCGFCLDAKVESQREPNGHGQPDRR